MSPAVAATSAYDIVKVSSMTIDGNLADWANISAITMADNSGRTGGVDNTAKVKLAWDNTYLYVAYDVTDTELLAIQTTRDHGGLYTDDGIDIYIDPQGDGAGATSMTPTDYQVLGSVREVLGDYRGTPTGGKDVSFNAQDLLAKAVTNGTLNATGTDVGYTTELRISWSDLGVTPAAGHFMRMDLAVNDRDGTASTTEEFDWAGLTGTFNNPGEWKDVQLVNPPPPPSAYDIVKVPAINLDGNLSDWAGVANISMADDPNNGRGSLNNSAKVKLAWDNTYLYAAYDVTDTDLRALQTTRDQGSIYQDDGIELYLDPQGDGATAGSMTATDYQLLANVRGAVGDMKGNASGGKDATFTAASLLAQAATSGTLNASGTDTGYALELRVAWADLGISPATGNFMRIDPAVNDRDGDPPPRTEEFDWANLTGTFNNPSSWKDVKLAVDASAPSAPTSPAATAASSSQINLAWTASASPDVNSYRIYRGTTGTPTLLTTVSGTTYQNTGLTSGTTYKYQISAVDAAGNESPRTAEKSATTSGGGPGAAFVVGPWNAPPALIGANGRWSGLQNPGYAPNLEQTLQSLRSAQARIVLSVLRSRMKDGAGHFSTAAFANEIAVWDNEVDLGPYFADNTIIAINVMDDNAAAEWGAPVTSAQVDSLAKIVKDTWPSAKVSTRTRPTQLNDDPYTFQYLDLAWAQYNGPYRNDTPQKFRDAEVTAAKQMGLGLFITLNTLNGGCGSPTDACLPGIPGSAIWGTYENSPSVRRYQVSAKELLEYGKVFIAEPYNCALLNWTYSEDYGRSSYHTDEQYAGIINFDKRADVKDAWNQLVALGKARAPGHCERYTP